MENKNICKFIVNSSDDNIETNEFVFESDQDIIKSGTTLKKHRIILIKTGNGVFHFENNTVSFSAGDLIFAFSNESFYTDINSHCEYIYISFSGSRADSLFRRFGINKNSRKYKGFDGMIPLWQESLSSASKENIDLASEGILLYTLSRLSGFEKKTSNLIEQIIKITEARFNDPELSVTSISELLSYNPKYISHTFKEQMGMGYNEYLRNFRIKYSISLLEHGIDSVKNIAYLSGYRDPLYFSTVFRKTTGMSPNDYKKKLTI